MTRRAPSSETIWIELSSRWDAVDLARRLGGLHTYLVQLGDRRWHVCVRSDGETDALLPQVRTAAERWAKERRLSAVLRVRDRTFDLTG